MESINIRFKQLREICGKTQEQWATILGLSRSGISAIESGYRNVSKKHLLILQNWKERQVNIQWLETGEGEPFLQLPQTDELSEYVEELLMDKDDSLYKAIRSFMLVYGRLDFASKAVIQKSIDDWIAEMKKEQI